MWRFLVFIAACAVLTHGRVVKRQARPCPDKCKNMPLDISFIVDSSRSIDKIDFKIGLMFIQDFVDIFDIGSDRVRVSLVTYASRVYRQDAFGFSSYNNKTALKQAIGKVPSREGGNTTETGKAINWFLRKVQPKIRQDVRSVLIVLTDGNSQRPDFTKKAAKKAAKKGLEVFAIGVGNHVSQEELHNIASDDEHIFVVNDYNALKHIQKRLTYQTCGVTPMPVCAHLPVDISFVIDSSSSISGDNFKLELAFITEFLGAFTINPSSTRVSAIMFGKGAYDEQAIQFDQYKDEKETLDAIAALKHEKGTQTDTGKGINYMIDNFAPKFRPHAAHIGIIITDGKSQEKEDTKEAAARAREHGITTVAVGVGKIGENLNKAELEAIAGNPSRIITAEDFATLNAFRDQLIGVTCSGVKAKKTRQDAGLITLV